jgi:hypothetical protein
VDASVTEGLAVLSRLGAEVSVLADVEVVIDARNSSVGDEHVKFIAAVDNLTWLSLCGTRLTNAGALQLATLSNLEHLDLGETQIDGSCLHIVKHFGRLIRLDLEGISGVSRHCSYLYNHKTLAAINLSFTDITTADLVRLLENSNLEVVEANGVNVAASTLLGLNQPDADPYRCVTVCIGEGECVRFELPKTI